MADAAPQLQEAYDLIQSGDLPSARQLLDDIRPQNENNPDYWWLYTYAAEDAVVGRNALNRVRQLAPNYPGLADLSQELGIAPPQPLPPQSLPPQDTSKPPTLLDDDAFDIAKDDEFDDLEPETSDGNNLMPIVLGIAAIALVILVALFLINSFSGGTPDATDTPVIADNPTPEPIIPTIDAEQAGLEETDEVTEVPDESAIEEETEETATEEEIIEATEESDPSVDAEETAVAVIPAEITDDAPDPTDEPTATPLPTETATPEPEDPFETLAEDLAAFGVPEEEGVRVEDTDAFGDTYIVTTCSSIGPRATENIIGIIDTLAPSSEALADVDGFAFEVTDCEADNVRLTLGVDSETLASYWAGETSVSELQAALRRLS